MAASHRCAGTLATIRGTGSTNAAVESTTFCLRSPRNDLRFQRPGIISSKTSEILGLWNRRYYRMIECLFEATQTADGSPSVDERTRDGLVENACARVQVSTPLGSTLSACPLASVSVCKTKWSPYRSIITSDNPLLSL